MPLDARRKCGEGGRPEGRGKITSLGLGHQGLLGLGPAERRQQRDRWGVEFRRRDRRQCRRGDRPNVPAAAGEFRQERKRLAGSAQSREPRRLATVRIDCLRAGGLGEHVGQPREQCHVAGHLVDDGLKQAVEPVDDGDSMQVAKLHNGLGEKAAAAIVVERIDHDEHRWNVADTLLLEQLHRLECRGCREPGGEESEDEDASDSGVVGASIKEVQSGGPAAAAGLQVGDIVVGVDDVPITGKTDLTAQVRAHAAETDVTIT